jgi:hypothetical protein
LATIPVVIAGASKYNDFSATAPGNFDGNVVTRGGVIYRDGDGSLTLVIETKVWIYREPNGDGGVDDFFNKGSGGRRRQRKLLVLVLLFRNGF